MPFGGPYIGDLALFIAYNTAYLVQVLLGAPEVLLQGRSKDIEGGAAEKLSVCYSVSTDSLMKYRVRTEKNGRDRFRPHSPPFPPRLSLPQLLSLPIDKNIYGLPTRMAEGKWGL